MFNILNEVIDNSGIANPVPSGSAIVWVVTRAVNIVSFIAFGVSFVMLAFSFVQFTISTGDPKKVEKPKSALTWSIIGLVLALALQAIKSILIDILGYDEGVFL